MNRRSFLRGVLLGAAALALPGKGKAAEPEPAVSAELAADVGEVFDALDDLDRIEASQRYALGMDWLGKFDADMRQELREFAQSTPFDLQQAQGITLDWLPDGMEHPSCRCELMPAESCVSVHLPAIQGEIITLGDYSYYLHDEA